MTTFCHAAEYVRRGTRNARRVMPATVMDLTIDLPLPPEVIHPNGRTRSYHKRARLLKAARGWANMAARCVSADGLPWDRATVQAYFTLPRKRDGDGLNAWLKPYLDGLQDAGIVQNDSGVTLLPPIQETGKGLQYGVRLVVKRALS